MIREPPLAEIREDNVPSLGLFERCGFERLGGADGFCSYRLSGVV